MREFESEMHSSIYSDPPKSESKQIEQKKPAENPPELPGPDSPDEAHND
jgi:hypothetical protein